MTRVHDMGGRFGDGPVLPDAPDAPVFATDWHAHAMAITVAAASHGRWNLDAMRHARERLTPQDYMRFSYYEKWIAALADMAVTRGLVTAEELSSGKGTPPAAPPDRTLSVAAVSKVVRDGSPYDRPGPPPRFAVGETVRTGPARNATVPGGHTRLPAYAARQTGRIVAHRGAFVFPDSNAHFAGESPQNLYTVAFMAADLWGFAENPKDEVLLDLFEPYLAPA